MLDPSALGSTVAVFDGLAIVLALDGRVAGSAPATQKRLGTGNVDWSGAVGEAVRTISDD